METDERDRLVEAHLPLVRRVVAQECRRLCISRDLEEELRSFGTEGLCLAAADFDPERGLAFGRYAERRIRWRIYDGLRTMGWLPRSLHRQIGMWCRAQEMLRYHRDDPAPQSTVEAAQRLSDRLRELATAYVTSYVSESGNESAAVPARAEAAIIRSETVARLRRHVDALPEIEHRVVVEYFFNKKKMAEIAETMGVTSSWVSRLLTRALQRLHDALNADEEMLDALWVLDDG